MKKLSILVLSLVLVLGTLGVAYAAWSQGLTIKGTVNTGYISASFTGAAIVVEDGYAEFDWNTDGYTHKDANNGALFDVLNLVIDDAYPGYRHDVTFTVKNNGTVPFWMDDFDDTLVTYSVPGIFEITAAGSYKAMGSVEPDDSETYTITIHIPGEYGGYTDPIQKGTYIITIPLGVTQSNANSSTATP